MMTPPTLRSEEESQGIKRVDYLGDDCFFNGLVRAEQSRCDSGIQVKLRVGNK